MLIIGYKSCLAFELGPMYVGSKQHQHITIWVGGELLNPHDDVVYLPGFYSKISRDIDRIEREPFELLDTCAGGDDVCFSLLQLEGNENLEILSYDVSICAAKCFYVERNGEAMILFYHWDPRHQPSSEIGKVFSTSVDRTTLLSILREARSHIPSIWV